MEYTLSIEVDECPENPLNWDHAGTLACVKHRYYKLGDRDAENRLYDAVWSYAGRMTIDEE